MSDILQNIDFSNLFPRNSARVLVIANLVPLFGVLFLGWSAVYIVILFWTENVIVGFFNIFKMMAIGLYQKEIILAILSILVFLFHYGFFTFGQGVITFGIFGVNAFGTNGIANVLKILSAVSIGIISLFLSHGFSFYDNFIVKKTYETKSLTQQMVAPYLRLFVMQFTIIIGAFLIVVFRGPLALLIILIILKIWIDLQSHLNEYQTKPSMKKGGFGSQQFPTVGQQSDGIDNDASV